MALVWSWEFAGVLLRGQYPRKGPVRLEYRHGRHVPVVLVHVLVVGPVVVVQGGRVQQIRESHGRVCPLHVIASGPPSSCLGRNKGLLVECSAFAGPENPGQVETKNTY